MSEERPELNNENEAGYSLESILAEYKAQAFIEGEKRLSGKELAEKTAEILGEDPDSLNEEENHSSEEAREEAEITTAEFSSDDLPWETEPAQETPEAEKHPLQKNSSSELEKFHFSYLRTLFADRC